MPPRLTTRNTSVFSVESGLSVVDGISPQLTKLKNEQIQSGIVVDWYYYIVEEEEEEELLGYIG